MILIIINVLLTHQKAQELQLMQNESRKGNSICDWSGWLHMVACDTCTYVYTYVNVYTHFHMDFWYSWSCWFRYLQVHVFIESTMTHSISCAYHDQHAICAAMQCVAQHYTSIYAWALSHNQTGIGVSVYINIDIQVIFVPPTIELKMLSTLPLIHSCIHSFMCNWSLRSSHYVNATNNHSTSTFTVLNNWCSLVQVHEGT